MRTIFGLTDTLPDAQHAIRGLLDTGFAGGTISVMVRHPRMVLARGRRAGAPSNDGLSSGDGDWEVLAGGPMATALQAGVPTAARNAVQQVLVDAGASPSAARALMTEVHAGRILIAVVCDAGHELEARDVLDEYAPSEIPSELARASTADIRTELRRGM
jgi:hypothetical protein